ncbi:MAG: uracil-DNA glycosylase [Candidatus Hadarchaeales archaeon]
MTKSAIGVLEARARRCRRCSLHRTRTNVVFGSGPSEADVMLVGEAPGRMEDLAGLPFVGAAGRRLNRLLRMSRLKRNEVHITNVVLCRPPENRRPTPGEIEACRIFLEKRISAVGPRVIVALGKTASETLLGRKVKMAEDHGKLFESGAGGGADIFVTYHPAAALYSGKALKVMEGDFKKLGELVRRISRCGCADRL